MKKLLLITFWLILISVLVMYFSTYFSMMNLIGLIIIGLIVFCMVLFYVVLFLSISKHRYQSEFIYEIEAIEDVRLFQHKKMQEYYIDILNLGYQCYGYTTIPFGNLKTQVVIYFNPKNNSYLYMYPMMNNFVPITLYKETSPNQYLMLGATYFYIPFMIFDKPIDYYAIRGRTELRDLVAIFEKKIAKIEYVGEKKSIDKYLQQQEYIQSLLTKKLTEQGYLKPEIDENGCQKLTFKGVFESFKTQAFLFNTLMTLRAEKKFKDFFET